mmetsp:Transcript_14511/g.36250  ORF Transcript_14511/g.36250 Transcript_14511/m.36250 type:complete len:263 (-) Transcript_14511:515-1303(-)
MHFRAALPFAPKSPGCSLGAIALSADCDTFAQATATTSLYQSPAFALSAFTVPLFLPLPSAFLQTTLPFALADAAPACSLSALALAADRDAHASITATSSLNHQPDFALLAFTLPLLSPASTALLHTALPFGLVSAGYSLSAFARTAGRDPLAALTTSTSTTPSAFDLLAITLPHLSPAPAALLQTSFPFIASVASAAPTARMPSGTTRTVSPTPHRRSGGLPVGWAAGLPQWSQPGVAPLRQRLRRPPDARPLLRAPRDTS